MFPIGFRVAAALFVTIKHPSEAESKAESKAIMHRNRDTETGEKA